jgi:hypothetical protein
MSIIYSYPIKGTPANDDLILISDSASSPQFATKQIKVSSLPGGSASGVSSFNTLTGAVTITGGTNVTLNPVGNNIEINAAGGGGTPSTPPNSVQFNNADAFGGSANLTFTTDTLAVKHTVVVKGQGNMLPAGRLKLNCEQDSHAITLEGPAHSGGADYTLKFPSAAPGNTQILQSNNSGQLSWITTPSGGGGGVGQVTAGGVLGTSSGAPISISPTTGNVVVTSQAYAGTTNVGHVPSGGDATKFLRGDATWVIPTNTTYSAGTGLSLNTNTFSLATNAALTNLGGGTGSTFLQKDGTWATTTDTNTNIANTNLQLDSNRNLDLSNGDATDYALTFISTLGGASKNLFKFDQIGGTSPRFTAGHTESAYEGYVVLEGNGANRTGILQFENAAGTYYTSFQAPTTFGANQNIGYVLPNLQGAANSVLTNNGSGTLSWGSVAVVEEGTWTPSAYVAVGSAPTVATAVGSYIKIGDLVNCYFYLNVTSSSSANIPMIIQGLPFSASNTNGYRGTASISRNDGTNYIQQQATSGLVLGSQVSLKRPDIQATNPSGTTVSITNTETINASWYATAALNYVLEGTIIFKV